MLRVFLVAAVIVTVIARRDLDTEWLAFKTKFNKNYTPDVEELRYHIWFENMKYIEQHNRLYDQGLSTYYMGENEFSDLTNSEFVARMNGVRFSGALPQDSHQEPSIASGSVPDTVDWRTKGYVTPVKYQGQCGSCWSFSTTGMMEGQHFKKSGKLVSLSESNLVDCSQKYGNNGCKGGMPNRAMQYVITNGGIDSEESYPYVPKTRSCAYNARNSAASFSSYKCTQSRNESALQVAVAEVGPISGLMDASRPSFKHYKGGVYDEPMCTPLWPDHAVLTIGYGTQGSTAYWLVKNSWGTTWGMDGYVMMVRNKHDQCGLALQPCYTPV